MTDASYANPDLVALYDELNGWSAARDFYMSLPRRVPERVLDAGCGTGLLAAAFGANGHHVTGIDPARAMLDVAESREGGQAVNWHLSTLQDFRSKDGFELIYMTGHAFQCLLDDGDIDAAFQSTARLLGRDGRFVFETRNPAVRPWRQWTPACSRRIGTTAAGQPYDMFHKVLREDGQLITFETTFRLGAQAMPLLSRSTLRFCDLQDIVRFARQAALKVERCWGDWDRTALSEQSPEIIVSLVR